MQYLYPGQTNRTETSGTPTLTLPLRVGVAFVPEGGAGGSANQSYPSDPLSEAAKDRLLRQVAAHFRDLAFVKSIELIPSGYLQPGGGFGNLDQVRQMFGVDVAALVSFDQVQNNDVGFWSITYWTIVGAYVVPAEKNLTATMLDAALFDIRSRKLLFRAPGVSQVKGHATAVNLSEELRGNSEAGFQIAATNLVANLKTELAAFQERVKKQPEEVNIVRSPGYRSGAGAFGLPEVVLLAVFGLAASRVGRGGNA
jgi:rhombotail lipoprotein